MVTVKVTLGVLLTANAAATGPGRSVDALVREVREFCGAHEFQDGASWPRGEIGLRFLTEYGQDGRAAVLRLAQESSRDGKCALEILRAANDPGALPIARDILHRRRGPTFIQAQALVIVAENQDAASFDDVLAAFRTGDERIVGPAAYALGSLRDPRGWAELRAALTQPKYARETRALVRGMAQPGHEQAIPLIVEAVAAGKDTASSGCESVWRIGGVAGRRAAILLLESVHPISREQIAEQFRSSLVEKSGAEPREDAAADIAALDRIIAAAKRQQR